MYYGQIKNCDIADGEGVRVTLFVSGCTNRCEGCFQPQTWDFCYGQEFTKDTEEQIIQMLSIYTLKNTLSIGEIKRLLDGEYAIDGYGGTDLAKTYDRYIDVKQQNREYSVDILAHLMEQNGFDIENDRDFLLIAGSLLSLSNSLKNIAQELIDVRYPQIEEEPEKAEKPKKEKKKKKSAEDDKGE